MAIRTFGGGGSGGGVLEHVPLDGTETNMVAGFTGDSVTTDLAGDATLDQGTVTYNTNGHYNGTTDCFNLATANLIGTTGDSDHKVAIATAVTYGGMFFVEEPASESTPYFLVSSTAASSFNYGVAMVSDVFSIRFGAHTSTAIRVPKEAWFHLAVTSPANRLSFKFYLNGKLAYTSGAVTAGTVGAGDSLKIGNVAATNGDVVGSASDIIVADAEYGASAVKDLAENAFGHALP